MRNRLNRFIGWDESRVLVLLSGARQLVVVARTFLLFGLGTVASKMTRLIAVKTNSSFLGRVGGTEFGLLHKHIDCRLKEIGTNTAGIEVGWWCFGIFDRLCWGPVDVVGLHLQLVPSFGQEQDVLPS